MWGLGRGWSIACFEKLALYLPSKGLPSQPPGLRLLQRNGCGLGDGGNGQGKTKATLLTEIADLAGFLAPDYDLSKLKSASKLDLVKIYAETLVAKERTLIDKDCV